MRIVQSATALRLCCGTTSSGLLEAYKVSHTVAKNNDLGRTTTVIASSILIRPRPLENINIRGHTGSAPVPQTSKLPLPSPEGAKSTLRCARSVNGGKLMGDHQAHECILKMESARGCNIPPQCNSQSFSVLPVRSASSQRLDPMTCALGCFH